MDHRFYLRIHSDMGKALDTWQSKLNSLMDFLGTRQKAYP